VVDGAEQAETRISASAGTGLAAALHITQFGDRCTTVRSAVVSQWSARSESRWRRCQRTTTFLSARSTSVRPCAEWKESDEGVKSSTVAFGSAQLDRWP